ncbi:mechanosensitive ion channel domain-containing protein, partial [Klebsiella pneumoniae]|uniref:mechanosensitive ion channel domain-containing protein n=1 Tax=Klebsiella pneumoniae TaxID=573 RepID=UPI003B2875F2
PTIPDFDRKEVIIPNKAFVTERLINWSLSDTVTRVVIRLGVAFPVPFHFGDFIAFFIAQMNFQLVKGNVDVILPAQAVDGAV